MKRCPTCRRVYSDETLNFCRNDGSELSVVLLSDETPTALIQESDPQNELLRPAVLKRSESAWPSATITASPRPSLAVLPFTPLEAGSGDEYLGLGMADSLITKLSAINRITVRPTSAIRRYAEVGCSSVAVGREQQVDAVLEGSIQRAGDRIRVTARLVNVRDGGSLWGYQGDEEFKGIFEIQDSITEQIVASLVNDLSREEEKRINKRYTKSAEAFHLYLKGRYYWNKFTERDLEKAIDYFNKAVEQDPSYALAYSGLADCYGFLAVNYQAPTDCFRKEKAAALKAVEIDDTLAEPHTSLAAVKLFYDRDLPGTEQELKRAIALNDAYGIAYQLYGYYHHVIGRPDIGISFLKQALEVDPLSPITNSDLGWAYLFTRQYDRAVEQGLKALEIDPHFAMAHAVIGMAYEHQALHKKAIKELAKAVKLSNESPRVLAWLAHAYAKAGNTVRAEEVFETLMKRSKERQVDAYNIAVVRIGFGENEKAFESLEQAYEQRSGQLMFLQVDPVFDDLRADPRFNALLGRLGLLSASLPNEAKVQKRSET